MSMATMYGWGRCYGGSVGKEVAPEVARDWLVRFDEDGFTRFWFDGFPENPDGAQGYGEAAAILDELVEQSEKGQANGTVAMSVYDDGSALFEWLEEEE